MKEIYEEVAKQHGVSPEEVEREIRAALAYARALDLPQARIFWQNAPKDADTLIEVLAKMSAER